MYTHGQFLWLVLWCRQTYLQTMIVICVITQIGQKKANIQKFFDRYWIKKAHLQANLLMKCFSHTENFIRQTTLQVAGYISTIYTHSITQVVSISYIIGILQENYQCTPLLTEPYIYTVYPYFFPLLINGICHSFCCSSCRHQSHHRNPGQRRCLHPSYRGPQSAGDLARM